MTTPEPVRRRRAVRALRTLLGLVALVGAGSLTVLRLLQPERDLFVRLVTFAPLAVPVHLLALVLLLGSRRARPWALLAGVGLGLHLWWLAPAFVGDEPAPGDEAARLRVMTVNMLNGEGDPQEVVKAAAAEEVDLLAVQEITPSTLLEMEDAGLNEHLPFHAGEALYGVEGSMLFSRTPLTDERGIATRWTSFSAVTRVAGRSLRVVVTHPESPTGHANGWRPDHRALREAVTALRPDLVLGDLNATADHRAFADLLDTGLRDAAETANSGWQPTWPASGEVALGPFALPRLFAIDHVLTGERWTATSTRTVEIGGTDHAALFADLARRAVG